MCYTSGTTGDPKGVVYSHRSIYLHAMGIALPDSFDLSARDHILAIVPQFHVLAWGLPYAAFLTGASLAMPNRFLAPEPLAAFIAAARPNKAAGVPTVWQALLTYADAHPEADISSLEEAIVGGSACPPALMQAYEERHGITLLHAWGMTEMSPLGTLARPPAGVRPGGVVALPPEPRAGSPHRSRRVSSDRTDRSCPTTGSPPASSRCAARGSPAATTPTTTRRSSMTAGCGPATSA